VTRLISTGYKITITGHNATTSFITTTQKAATRCRTDIGLLYKLAMK